MENNLLFALYIMGALISTGFQYKMIEYRNPKSELLNKVAASFLIGFTLSWIMIGVMIYYSTTNQKPKKIITKVTKVKDVPK